MIIITLIIESKYFGKLIIVFGREAYSYEKVA